MEILTVQEYYQRMFDEEQKKLAEIEEILSQNKSKYNEYSQRSSDAYKRKDEKSNEDFWSLKKEEDYCTKPLREIFLKIFL